MTSSPARLILFAALLSLLAATAASFAGLLLGLRAGTTESDVVRVAVALRSVLTLAVVLLAGRAMARRGLAQDVPEAVRSVMVGLVVGGVAATATAPGHVLAGQLLVEPAAGAALLDLALWGVVAGVGVFLGHRAATPSPRPAATPYG